ncbi:MAG: hypothetical protein A2293_09350 [Elusimicrobia bacterium RIFOXYB2_FULL_49_7]|nr:MAG: hypothetical protein A2293_09350 [Elusimicrobia bacterium RIFOXYB2_FULL_49_7]
MKTILLIIILAVSSIATVQCEDRCYVEHLTIYKTDRMGNTWMLITDKSTPDVFHAVEMLCLGGIAAWGFSEGSFYGFAAGTLFLYSFCLRW